MEKVPIFDLYKSIVMNTTSAERQQGRINNKIKKNSLETTDELARMELVIKDPFSLVMEARKGVLARIAFEVANRLHLHADQLADILHTSTKTLRNYRQSKKKLNPAHSEQTLKLLAMHTKGQKVFGNPESFRRWLEKPAYGLDEQIPLDMLQTSGGIDLVMEELDRIAYGDLA
jgi:putative toxin-antitoxin system antitoxin component (TIGR02293 family)